LTLDLKNHNYLFPIVLNHWQATESYKCNKMDELELLAREIDEHAAIAKSPLFLRSKCRIGIAPHDYGQDAPSTANRAPLSYNSFFFFCCVPATHFPPTETYAMLNALRNPSLASWSVDGLTFVVWDTERFASDIIPKYFKHNNFNSFVRQLNFYRFKKMKVDRIKTDNMDAGRERKCWRFKHDNFRRGRPELLEEIKKGDHNIEPGAVGIQEVDGMMRELESLRSQVAALRADAKGLASFVLQTQHLGTAATAPNTGSSSGIKRESCSIDQNSNNLLSQIEKKHMTHYGPYHDRPSARPVANHSHSNEGTYLPAAPKCNNPDAPPTNISNYNDNHVHQSTSYKTTLEGDEGEMLVPHHRVVLSPQTCARFLQNAASSSSIIQEHGSHTYQQGLTQDRHAQRRGSISSNTSFGASMPDCFKDYINQLDADDFEPNHVMFPQGQAHTDDHTKGQDTSYGSLLGVGSHAPSRTRSFTK
jgi:hypothetical protein